MGTKPVKIACIGDSLTEGYHIFGRAFHPYSIKLQQLLDAQYGPSKFVTRNFGISGETTDQILHRMKHEQELDMLECEVWIILAGTNDLGGRDDVRITKNLQRMHEIAKTNKKTTLALTIPQHRLDSQFEWLPKIRNTVNQNLVDFCRQNSIAVVDFEKLIPYGAMSDEDRSKYWDDGLHLKPAGYNRLAEIIWDVLKPILDSLLKQSNS